jgi:hypothetical protein
MWAGRSFVELRYRYIKSQCTVLFFYPNSLPILNSIQIKTVFPCGLYLPYHSSTSHSTMYFNIQPIILLLSLSSGFITATAAAGASSANNLYALMKEQKAAERIETFKGLDTSIQKQVFINRINDYRENQPQQLDQQQNDILDTAIDLIQAGKPTSPLLEQGAKEAFGFDEFKRLLTTLDDLTVSSEDTKADVALTKPDCTCSTTDDWCDHDKGLHCKGDSISECTSGKYCCNYAPAGCGAGLVHECTGLCV